MSNEVISVLNTLCEKLGVDIDWTAKNMEPYINDLFTRYVNYEIVTSIMWCIISLLIILVYYIVFYAIRKKTNWLGYNDIDLGWVIFICVCLFALFVIVLQTFDIITCKTIPEKLIIEYISRTIGD